MSDSWQYTQLAIGQTGLEYLAYLSGTTSCMGCCSTLLAVMQLTCGDGLIMVTLVPEVKQESLEQDASHYLTPMEDDELDDLDIGVNDNSFLYQ